jgi:Tol biopolymer transport system component
LTAIHHLDGTIQKEIQSVGEGKVTDLAWSVRGILAYVLDMGDGTFCVYTLDPEMRRLSPQKILDREGTILNMRFSPDGKELVFVGACGASWSLFRAGADGRGLKELVQNLTVPEWDVWDPYPGWWEREKPSGPRPRWSPDGQRLLYANNGRITVINRGGTGLTDLTPKEDVVLHLCYVDEPVWSPDGTRIAFQRRQKWSRGKDRVPVWNIWTMNSDGEDLRQMTTGQFPGDDLYPEWSPW